MSRHGREIGARDPIGTSIATPAGMVFITLRRKDDTMPVRVPGFLSLTLVYVLFAGACGGGGIVDPDDPTGPPVVTSINGATQPTGPTGSTVIIEGSNFGGTQGSSQVLFSSGTGGTIPAAIAGANDWTSTFIITTVPAGASSGSVVVQTPLGTSAPLPFTVTQNAAFSPSTITWSVATELPVAVSGHALAFALLGDTTPTRVVYSLGGADNSGAPVSTVHLATAGAGGALGPWTATVPLPAPVAFHAASVATPANARITATGFVYVVGGATDAAGTPASIVYRGALAADGSVSAWVPVTPLPAALHSAGAVIFHGDLYVAGGATTANAPSAAVYRSRIDATGGLGPWQAQPSLPFARAHFGFGTFGGYLYTFGGDSAVVTPHSGTAGKSIADVAFARINLRTGDLEPAGWTTGSTKLTKSVSKHTAVVAGGYVLTTAGLYNGAANGSTEQSYSQFNADGTVGSFNGATGSNTIASLVAGGNLFNHAAIGYTDAAGAFHVLVAGGDDVNTPGSRHQGVFFY
jgi:hypothetical protein